VCHCTCSTDVLLLVDAGSDTTAIALTHVMWQLIQIPTKLAKLRHEIQPLFEATESQSKVVPSYVSLSQCTYLKACLDEALRLHPPVSAGLQRRPPLGGMMIDGVFVSEEINVSVPAYVIHRNPELFPDPDLYLPERWLAENNVGTKNSSDAQSSFIPFSAGSRG
jgi:cytochrome P450